MRSLVPALLLLAFTVYVVIDVVRSESSEVRGLSKTFWVVLCLLFPLAGGIAWLVAGRPRTSRLPGAERLARPRPPVQGPDDDPDFLRSIDRPRPVPPAGPLTAGPLTTGPLTTGPLTTGPTDASSDGTAPAGTGPRDAGPQDQAPRDTAGPGDGTAGRGTDDRDGTDGSQDDDGETGPGATAGTDDRRP